MTNEMAILTATAATVGFFHTLLGPDHYLPFIVMAKANRWSKIKTAWITILCGIGHVGSSVVLGTVGIAFGIAVSHLQFLESFGGNIAAWLLIGFGLVYFIWGVRQAVLNKPHSHRHIHQNGTVHSHTHTHAAEHVHVHDQGKKNMTPWILFTIFVLGPCEPLIPILMYPAAQKSIGGTVLVASVFSIVTILTMLSVVFVSLSGINLLPAKALERYMHALAGAAILFSGLGIQFLGL